MSRTGISEIRNTPVAASWLLCAALAVAVQMPLALNHDAAWHFYTSFRVLAGDELGREIFDINPPMSAWLFLLPASIVEISGASPAVAFKAFTLAICSGSYFWTMALLSDEDQYCWPAALALGLALFIMPAYDFGQREHLVAALTLPYVVLAGRRAGGMPIATLPAVLVGVAAGIGIGIKPHFLALPLAIELWFLFRTRRMASMLRPEFYAMAGLGVAYLAAVAAFAPGYYLYVVPDALSNYGGFGLTWLEVVSRSRDYLLLALCAFVLGCAAAKRWPPADTAQAASIAALGFLVAALLQKKGWPYQFYPVALYLVFAAGLMAIGRRTRRPGLDPLALAASAFIVLCAMVPAARFLQDGHSAEGTTARVEALRKTFAEAADPGQSVFAFITSPRDIHPAVLESRRRWAGSAGAMMYLPAEINLPAGSSAREERIRLVSESYSRDLIDRLMESAPAVIAVDDRPYKLGIGDPEFDYVRYFSRYPSFDEFWSDYAERERLGGFRIFVREDAVVGPDARDQANSRPSSVRWK